VGEKVVRDGIKGPTVDSGFVKKLREGWELVSKEIGREEGERMGNGKRDDQQDRVKLGKFVLPKTRKKLFFLRLRQQGLNFSLSMFISIGMLLRNPSIHDGQHMRWHVSLFWSLVVDLVQGQKGERLLLHCWSLRVKLIARILE